MQPILMTTAAMVLGVFLHWGSHRSKARPAAHKPYLNRMRNTIRRR
ncbi:MAG: hypothetical protein ABJB17_06260 [Burkholderiales bacterium]